MHHLIYLSRATQPLSDEALATLLRQARHYNAQHELTGVLAYGNGQFMQLLEGEQAAIDTLYARIQQDPRHENIVRFADKAIAERSFPTWSMAFVPLDTTQLAELENYVLPDQLAGGAVGLSGADELLVHTLHSFVFPASPAS